MRILSCTTYHYYGSARGIEPQFYYLYKVPNEMGIDADHFDFHTSLQIGREHMRRQFLTLLKGGGYDAVFIATHEDEFDRELLREARAHCPVIAWNSDDEWRWKSYSSKQVDWYTFMVTNSPDVYQSECAAHPNLLHAQWACTGFWDGRATPKEIDFSFVGQVYGSRLSQASLLQRKAGLVAYGRGSSRIWDGGAAVSAKLRFRCRLQGALMRRVAPSQFREATTISFEAVNDIWNRSRVSFTPLESSTGGRLQIKSRVFDMGLSGTVMLAPAGAGVERYYVPGREFIEYHDLQECADKARYLCRNETERRRIADAYAARTLGDHMWKHRIEHVLAGAGLTNLSLAGVGGPA